MKTVYRILVAYGADGFEVLASFLNKDAMEEFFDANVKNNTLIQDYYIEEDEIPYWDW